MIKYFRNILGINYMSARITRLETALKLLPHAQHYLDKVDKELIKKQSQRYDEVERTRKRRSKRL